MAKEKSVKELEDLPGIGPTSAEKLRASGYANIEKVAASSSYELSELLGISPENAKKAVEAAREATNIEVQTGAEALEKRKAIGRISTGASGFDELLGGGVETNGITEVYGRFASGKTQIGFQLAVNVQKPVENGGLGGSVLFLDTEGTFRPERIEAIAKAQDMDPKKILDNIYLSRVMSTDQQILTAERADKLIREKGIRLVIVDSLMALFRSEFIGRGALNERQQKLNAHIHKLQRLADAYSLAVYITNQVMDNPGMLFGDPTTPVGGNVVAHAATTRLYIRKSKEEKRIIRLVDSPSMPEGETVIKITPDGIKD